jgi:hypothetical protein
MHSTAMSAIDTIMARSGIVSSLHCSAACRRAETATG